MSFSVQQQEFAGFNYEIGFNYEMFKVQGAYIELWMHVGGC